MARWPNNQDEDQSGAPGEDWDLSEGLDPDGPSAADLDRFGDELSNCPDCHQPIYDQAPICPNCGHAMEDKPRSMSLWTVFAVFALIGLLLLFVY